MEFEDIFPAIDVLPVGHSDKGQLGSQGLAVLPDGRPSRHPDRFAVEHELSYWTIAEARMTPGSAEEAPQWRGRIDGAIELMVTDSHLRGSFVSGSAPGQGEFHGGFGVIKPKRVLTFAWPLVAIDVIEHEFSEGGRFQKLADTAMGAPTKAVTVESRLHHAATLLLADAKQAKSNSYSSGFFGRDQLPTLFEELVERTAEAAAGVPERSRRAELARRREYEGWTEDGVRGRRFVFSPSTSADSNE